MDVNETGRVIHALDAIRRADGDLTKAAALTSTSAGRLQEVLDPSAGRFWNLTPDGRIRLTPMGDGFADRVATFPRVNW